MDTIGYVDIFATKGIEYLLVVSFLLALIGYWRWLNRPSRQVPAMEPARAGAGPDWFRLSRGVLYHQGHAWAAPEGDSGIVRVGLDDFAQKMLGRAQQWIVPEVGAHVEQGRPSLGARIDSKTIDLLAPVAGEVIERNQAVLSDPQLVNDDPYGTGWLMRVRVADMQAQSPQLLQGPLARAWMEQNVLSLRERMAGEVGMALQDGGAPVSGFARSLSGDQWDEIAREFLLTR